jgi:YD repeat-containing protein
VSNGDERLHGFSRKLTRYAAIASCFLPGLAYADAPAVVIAKAPIVTPADALIYYGSPASPTARPRSPLVQETARSLRYDVDLIYAYVRNNIEFLPMFGLQAGARGIVLNGRGTAFDQAQFMVDLLREADARQAKGYNPAYVLGRIELSSSEFAAWTGVNDAAVASKLLANGGIPATVTGSGSTFTVTMLHCWVRVTIGGTDYLFDPSFKPSVRTAGMAWQASTGYSRAALLASAGGTQTATQVSGFNIPNFQSQLSAYRANAETFLSSNAAGKRAESVVGFDTITSHPATDNRRTTIPYIAQVDRIWTGEVPDIFRTAFTVSLNGTSYGTYNPDEVAGEIWQFEYARSGSVFVASGTPAGRVIAGQIQSGCDKYQSNRGSMAPAIASVSINHPYAANGGGYADRTLSRQLTAQQCGGGLFYVSNDWGFSGNGINERLAPAVSRLRIDPTAASWMIFAPTLANVATQYSAFLDVARYAQAQRYQMHDLVGIHVLDNVDLYLSTPSTGTATSSLASSLSMSFESAVSAIADGGTADGDTSAAYTAALGLSYAEGAVPRQETDSVYDMASINLLTQQDMRASSPGTYSNYLATPMSWASVKTSLSSYPGGSLSAMDGYVAEGYSLIAPQIGALRQPQITVSAPPFPTAISSLWEGLGLGSTGSEVFRSAFLAWRPGSGTSIPDRIAMVMYDQRRGSILKAGIGVPIMADGNSKPIRKPEVPKAEGKDVIRAALNIDGRSGAVTFAPGVDLTDGSGDFPRSLSLQRLYDQRDQTNYGFGIGWKHNWHQVATFSNDGQAALGQRDAQALGSILVSLQAIGDLTRTQDAQHLYAALQVAGWMGDQTINNSVVISRGFDGEETFRKQADGSYANAKPNGSALTVTGSPRAGIINRRLYIDIGATYIDSGGAARSYASTPYSGLALTSPAIASLYTRKSQYMTDWRYPNGIHIRTAYGGDLIAPDVVFFLRATSNLGNAIYRGNDPGFDPGSDSPLYYCEEPGGPILSRPGGPGQMQFRNSAGQEARFNISPMVSYYLYSPDDPNCPTGSDQPPVGRLQLMSYLGSKQDSAGKLWGYAYATPASMFGAVPILNRAYKPSNGNPDITIDFGGDANAITLTNLRDKIWRYYSLPFRSEVVSPEQHDAVTSDRNMDAGRGSVIDFDEYAQPIRSIDPLGRVTATAYNDQGRPVSVTQPELNVTLTAYDPRGNPITQTQRAKPGSSEGDLVTSASYVGGAGSGCANLATCNKPAYTIDARGYRTNYSWDGITGELLSVTPGLNAAGTACMLAGGLCPTTSYGYGSGIAGYDPWTGTASGTLYFPFSKTETITLGVNRTTSYSYFLKSFAPTTYQQMTSYTVKKVLPKEIVTDPGGLNLRQCYEYDLVGNVVSGTTPRAGLASCP